VVVLKFNSLERHLYLLYLQSSSVSRHVLFEVIFLKVELCRLFGRAALPLKVESGWSGGVEL